jgi:hypothetical protein
VTRVAFSRPAPACPATSRRIPRRGTQARRGAEPRLPERGPEAADLDDENNHRRYATPDGNAERFIGEAGLPSLHLARYGQGEGLVLRFCEDSTGLLVGPTDRRLLPAGLLVSNLRGGRHYESDLRAGGLRSRRRGAADPAAGLAASLEVLAHVRAPRPPGSPAPAYTHQVQPDGRPARPGARAVRSTPR